MKTPTRSSLALLALALAGGLGWLSHSALAQGLNFPNDEFFPEQWHLLNTGQHGGSPGFDINVLPVWSRITRGGGVTIALVDDGLEINHPDLKDNTPALGSPLHHDFNDGDDDPNPVNANDTHGTLVGGLIAARQNNTIGVSGVAPEARLLGLRLLADPSTMTDANIASAHFWDPKDALGNSLGANVGVLSSSLIFPKAPSLRGFDVLAKAALRDAAISGRNGNGQITVFPAGDNADIVVRSRGDNTNYSGASNSRFTITVGAITAGAGGTVSPKFAPDSTPGASILVCAPGGGSGFDSFNQRLATTDISGPAGLVHDTGDLPNADYTRKAKGTAAAAGIVSGTAALMLSASSGLGWRDVKEILASTARKIDETDAGAPGTPGTGWIVNGAGFNFNDNYGAGLVDAFAAVARSVTWKNLGPEVMQQRSRTEIIGEIDASSIPNAVGGKFVGVHTFAPPLNPNIRVEQVEVEIRANHQASEQLEVTLISPTGTRSVLARAHTANGTDKEDGIQDRVLDFTPGSTGIIKKRNAGWVFSTTHHWGENSTGRWTIEIIDRVPGDSVPRGTVIFTAVRLYGTASGTQRVAFDQPRYTVSKPPAGQPAVNFPIFIKRIGGTTGTFSVDYSTAPASNATPNVDYTPTQGTVTFTDGEKDPKVVMIPILPNNVPENTQTVAVVLSNLQGANVSFGAPTLTRIDIVDTTPITVSVVASDPQAAETDNVHPVNRGVFTVTRSKLSLSSLDVHFAITGTARLNTDGTGDYDISPTSTNNDVVTIGPNELSATVTITPREDSLFEGSETVDLTVSPDPTYRLGSPGSATVTILDNDLPKIQIITLPGGVAQEGSVSNPLIFRISRNIVTSQPLLVFLDFGGSQILGTDYRLLVDGSLLTDPSNSSVEIPANQDHVDITLLPLDNTFYQATKSVQVSLRPNPDYTFAFGFRTFAQAIIRENDPFPDTRIPTVSITAPRRGARIVSPAPVAVTGRATDNKKVKSVEYRLNRVGEFIPITPAITPLPIVDWSVNITPVLGPNTVEVRSIDEDRNESVIAVTTFNYVKMRTLTVNIVGGGTVTRGFTPSSLREVGTVLSITATPTAGNVFSGWSGLVSSIARTISFTVPDADSTLTATFVQSPFVGTVAGVYNGLAQESFLLFQASGMIQVTLVPTGVFTGKLILGGITYPLRGEFNGSGDYFGQVKRKNDTTLDLSLHVALAPGDARKITGTIESNTFTSIVSADRAAFDRTHPAPADLVHSYTLFFPQPPAGAGRPLGYGWGTMKIDTLGVVRWSGQLPDGTRVTQTVPLAADGTWPLFLSLYVNKGVMLGTVTHVATAATATLPASDLSAKLDWFKPVVLTDKYFTLGFSIEDTDLLGSIYTPPPAGTRVLANFTNAVPNGDVKLEDGKLPFPILKDVTLATTNKVTVFAPGADKLSIAIAPTTGAFTGSFVHPISLRATPIAGIVYQKGGKAFGTFLGTSVPGDVQLQTGRVTLEPK